MANLGDVITGLRQLAGRVNQLQAQLFPALARLLDRMENRPPSITDLIDRIPGRRIEYRLSGSVLFTIAADGTRGEPVTVNVSQDGPFVMTHYPMVLWKPTLPTTATNFGRWRPVTTFPLPDQTVDTDVIDLSYEVMDGGSQRLMQSAASGPIFSRPDNLIPLPVPTLFRTNATIQLFPTYNNILFDAATPPTEGELQVDFIGYRIVNL